MTPPAITTRFGAHSAARCADVADVAKDARRERAEALVGVGFVGDEARERVHGDDLRDRVCRWPRPQSATRPGRPFADHDHVLPGSPRRTQEHRECCVTSYTHCPSSGRPSHSPHSAELWSVRGRPCRLATRVVRLLGQFQVQNRHRERRPASKTSPVQRSCVRKPAVHAQHDERTGRTSPFAGVQ